MRVRPAVITMDAKPGRKNTKRTHANVILPSEEDWLILQFVSSLSEKALEVTLKYTEKE